MQIKTENIEKNSIVNFYPQQPLPISLPALVSNKNFLPQHEFLRNITTLENVARILVTPDLISVKFTTADFAESKMLIMAEIDEFLADPHSLLNEKNQLTDKDCAEAIADALIRPTLNRDGGDISIHHVGQNTIEIAFTGHCAGCPYAQNTLQNVIMKTFMRYMPQINEVKLI